MNPRVKGEYAVERRKLILLPYLFAVSCLLITVPVSSKQKTDWKTYHLDVMGVSACAFTPDSRRVAFLYYTGHTVSQKPDKLIATAYLSVWDFNTGNIEEKLTWSSAPMSQGDPWAEPISVEYSSDGRYLIILEASAIRVLDARTYKEVKEIVYEDPKEKVLDDAWKMVGLSLAADGSRAAVAISSSIGANGGFVRVYDLKTGQILREWRLHDGVRYVTGAALSPDGERVAVSSLPIGRSSDPEAFIPSGINNVRVMDVKSGETITGMNTNYVAGPPLFGSNDSLLTVSINDDRKGYSLDSVKIWDARTGKLLREIGNPHVGVHYRLDLSPDGKLLLGYTGTEKPVENFVIIDTQRFQIWDFASGTVVATSPEIQPIKLSQPRMRFSPDKRLVVVWWDDGSANPIVYEIPQH
jgi:WD40 repeat protein